MSEYKLYCQQYCSNDEFSAIDVVYANSPEQALRQYDRNCQARWIVQDVAANELYLFEVQYEAWVINKIGAIND